MGEKSSQIAAEIERSRAELGANLQEFEQKVKAVADWRQQFRRNPFVMIGIAFTVGLIVALGLGGRRSARAHQPRGSGI